MNVVGVMLRPVNHGWAVTRTDGRELIRFTGLWARWRAQRYLISHDLGKEASHVR
jgi:hypothetical protein